MKKQKLKEKEIQKFILDFLNLSRIGYFWRNNTGAMTSNYNGKARFMKFGEVGSADIVGVLFGKFVAIECKAEGVCKISEKQNEFREKIEKNDGIYYVANDLNSFEIWIKELNHILKNKLNQNK